MQKNEMFHELRIDKEHREEHIGSIRIAEEDEFSPVSGMGLDPASDKRGEFLCFFLNTLLIKNSCGVPEKKAVHPIFIDIPLYADHVVSLLQGKVQKHKIMHGPPGAMKQEECLISIVIGMGMAEKL